MLVYQRVSPRSSKQLDSLLMQNARREAVDVEHCGALKMLVGWLVHGWSVKQWEYHEKKYWEYFIIDQFTEFTVYWTFFKMGSGTPFF